MIERKDYIKERDKELLSIYLLVCKMGGVARVEAIKRAAESRASRFFISPEETIRVLRENRKGKTSRERKNKNRIEMFEEISKRVEALQKEGYTEMESIERVVYSPAPKFYIGTRAATESIYSALRNGKYRRKR